MLVLAVTVAAMERQDKSAVTTALQQAATMTVVMALQTECNEDHRKPVYFDKFACFGLEDEYREDKVASETRIPAGSYIVGIRAEGGFHQRYKFKFNSIHKGMLQVKDVPGFEYILIHVGNTDDDTAGCLLLGEQAQGREHFTVNQSVVAYRKFYKSVIEAALDGELFIEYIDSD